MSFWNQKRPCWQMRNCLGQPGKGKDCVAYQHQQHPCWKLAGTLCKGPSGKDLRECKACKVYLEYGEGKPIIVFDPNRVSA